MNAVAEMVQRSRAVKLLADLRDLYLATPEVHHDIRNFLRGERDRVSSAPVRGVQRDDAPLDGGSLSLSDNHNLRDMQSECK